MAETTTAPKQSWIDTLGNWVTKAGQIFGTATEVYVAADQRIKALESIDEDTGTNNTTVVERVNTSAPSMPSWVMPAVAVGLVLIGILVARKMR